MGVDILAFGFCLLTVAVTGGESQRRSSLPLSTVCKADEEYQKCGCLRTCCNEGKPLGCDAQCKAGCFCKGDLVRNKNGDCIPLEDCNKTTVCPSNEEYSECVNPCNDCEIRGKCQFLVCNKGCDCKQGYHRDEQGKCIPAASCPPKGNCPQDEQYYENIPNCKNTCEHYNNPGVRCRAGPAGCFCKEGLVKRKDGKCVNPQECVAKPPVCGKDEMYYKECAPSCTRTCEAYNNKGVYHCPNCQPGCWCKENLYKDSTGKCVPASQCSTEQCGKNEVFKPCGTACPLTCSNLDDKPVFCEARCVKGCFCKEEFIRNEQGVCVDPEECPSRKCDGQNEVYDSCGSACPKTCENKDKNILCTLQCVPGCTCIQEFVRNAEGKCIDPSQCEPSKAQSTNQSLANSSSDLPSTRQRRSPSKCPPDEQYYENIPNCKNTCENHDNPGIRCAAGPAGCFCKEGFVKRKDGKCVNPRECVDQCGVDEVYQECGTACPRTCESLYTKIRCIEKCVPGCFCRDDLVRHNGKCIDIRKCQTHQCGQNEVYKECGTACPLTCPSVDKPMDICTDQCVSGCFCEEGFVRNDRGDCVKTTDCPSNQCGVDEEYRNCGTACPLTCSNFQKPVQCSRQCVKGCFCKQGLVRNDDGKCVNPNQCPLKGTCGNNEEYQDCGTACPRTCKNLPYQMRCIAQCVQGCFCKEGMVRNDDNECVDPQECPSEECGENEEFNNCGSACPRTCENKDKNIFCTLQCKLGCFCKKGYVRNNDGKCVLPEQCPKECNGENEVLVDCAKPKWCNTCEIRGNCKLASCDKGCDCKPGYYRNAMEVCIPESQCSSPTGSPNGSDCDKGPEVGPCKGAMPRFYYDQGSGSCKSFIYGGCKGNRNNFETEDDCNKHCGGTPSQSDCDQPLAVGKCRGRIPRFYYDKESGRCKKFNYGGCGGNKNNFKSVEECNKKCRSGTKCPANEEHQTCGTACPATCSNRGKPINCTKQCVKGCFCKEGLVRNDDGQCVQPDTCPPEKCPWNEEYQECGTGCPKTCRNLNIKIRCIDQCFPGCFCKEGLVRNDDGECVKPSECPSEQCGENEEYSNCASACPVTCANKDTPIVCTLQCKIGCTCKKGYVENDEGKCVLPEECPTEECTGINEALVDCAKPKWCNTCGIRGNCKLTMCEKGCDCKPNYYRDDSGICIFKAQCPNYCPTNEEYSKCVIPCNDCETRGKCNFLLCNEGCDCKKGYYRDTNNKCIPEEKCPIKDQCDEGEEYKVCGTACPRTCSNLNIKIKCIDKCVEGCFCKDGLVRNGEGKCVEPKKCPNEKCNGYNEEFVDCAKPKSCNTCEIKGNCKLKKCEKGCDCKPNYYRNATEICIPEAECSNPPQCAEDEEFYNCTPDCKNSCKNYNKPHVACPKICRRGCFCKKGLVKRSDGKCVSPTECDNPTEPPGHNCGPREEFYSCVPTCQHTCETYNNTHMPCPRICRSGCFCKKGLVLREDNKCVPPRKCNISTEPPSHNCKPREEFYNCVPTCRHTCETYNNTHMPCPLICRSGCFCKKGLVLRKDNKCVPPRKCNISTEPPGQTCGPREQHYDCLPDCRNTCEALNKKNVICPLICRSGCFCKEGLVLRKEDNKCVRPSKCNNQTEQCGRNEEYNTCGNACQKTCDNKDKPYSCTQECKPGCFCKEGYVRNSEGKCVRPNKCPSEEQCGRHEEYSTCGSACEKTCENKDEEIVCTQECKTGCFCKEGYVRNSEGKCVRPSKCPSEEQCGRNEEYNTCGNPCEKTCDNKDKPYSCIQECKPGCFCKEGYVRNSEGKCVRPKRCPSEPGTEPCKAREQYYDCIPRCHNTCETYNRTDIACREACRSGCFCKEGYVLRNDNKCVRPAKCNITTEPPNTCGPRQEHYDCVPNCHNTCETYNKTDIACSDLCRPGCFCKKGLVLRKDNKCVRPAKCNNPTEPPPVCGEDEEYYEKCAPSCTGSCDTYGKEAVILCLPCKPGCWCKKGLVKDKDGKCILPSKCPSTEPPHSCPKDQEYYPCIPTCQRTCMSFNSTNAYCPKECIKGCFCKEGLVMDKNSQCVKPEQCSTTCNFTEQYYDCKPDCHNRCNPPKLCDKACRPGCFCRKDLLLRDDGMCVRKELCNDLDQSTKHHCGPDKKYYECYSRCGNTCSTYGKQVACPALCEKGCFCKEGMVMDEDEQCVAPEECEGEGELVSEETITFEKEGFEVEGFGFETEGFEEEERGEVRIARQVYSERDQETYGPGELWSAGTWPVGSSRQPPRNRKPIEFGSRRFGYFSGRTNTRCGINEAISQCVSPISCNTCVNRRKCRIYSCSVGCDCLNGYYRNENGVCIPESQCPPPGCGINERMFPCAKPVSCNTCELKGNCRLPSCNFGCDCIEGYYRNERGVCIPESQCPQPEILNGCGINEMIILCAKPKFCDTCAIRGNCENVICDTGCACMSGYYRDESGECIPESECPKPGNSNGCDINEMMVECAKPKFCNTCANRENCGQFVCDTGCDCIAGYYRDERGVCIPESQCPLLGNSDECGINEEVVECAKPKACNTCFLRGNCDLQNCTRGCDCMEGFYRDEVRVCIPESECPEPEGDPEEDCGPNEEWNDCGSACPMTCDNYGRQQLCTLQCIFGCFCKQGFVRNAQGACVHHLECPSQSASKGRNNLRRGSGTRTRGQVLSQMRLEDLRLEPSEYINGDTYYSDGSSMEDLSRNAETNGYSEIVMENNRFSNENAGEEEWTWSEGRTGGETGQSYLEEYSEETVDESEGSNEYTEWEIMSA